MVCTERQVAKTQSDFRMKVAELMCSGLGDCVLWKQADSDRDGVIGPKELGSFLDSNFGIQRKSSEIERSFSDTFRPSQKDEYSKFVSRCTQMKGTLQEARFDHREFKVSCTVHKEDSDEKVAAENCGALASDLKDVFGFNDIESAERFLTSNEGKQKIIDNAQNSSLFSSNWDWPNKCGVRKWNSGFNKGKVDLYRNCKLSYSVNETRAQLTCILKFNTEHHGDGKNLYGVGGRRDDLEPPVPITGNFTLVSALCGEESPQSLIQKNLSVQPSSSQPNH